jgi:hypothetical protein
MSLDRLRHFTTLALVATLFFSNAVGTSAWSSGQASDCLVAHLQEQVTPVASLKMPSERYRHLAQDVLPRLDPSRPAPVGTPRIKIMLGVYELGKIPGLKTVEGKPLSMSVGGIGTTTTDFFAEIAPMLERDGVDAYATVPLMNHIGKQGMSYEGSVKVRVDDRIWENKLYHYSVPGGGHVIFLDNPSYTRYLTVAPPARQSLYDFQGLPEGHEGYLTKQRIDSSLNQSVAQVYSRQGAEMYFPQDGHLAPASYYIVRNGNEPITVAPKLHNERYLDTYSVAGPHWDEVRRIWNLNDREMGENFVHDDQFVKIAPAVRTAEQTGVFTARSVADHTAHDLNAEGLPSQVHSRIELFDRVGAETNFLGEINRPSLNPMLARATEAELRAEGITDPEVIREYGLNGYQFGFKGQSKPKLVAAKAKARRAAQRILGMEIDPAKPLVLGFARLVQQKGLGFVADQVEYLLSRGAQVVVGGPVGDEVGAAERKAFLAVKAKLNRERNPNARNFVFIDGPVKGRVKALLLAGADLFPVPSRFEPCGLTDVEALYSGALPVAHAVGGLRKGKNSILYGPTDPDAQGPALHQAFARSLDMFHKRPNAFRTRQVAAMGEDFSAEKHYAKFMLNNRVEVYEKMLREIDTQVAEGAIDVAHAHALIRRDILEGNPEDMGYLARSLQMFGPTRRTPSMEWLIRLAEGSR